MAYQQPRNPDALPWFAEPDKRAPSNTPASYQHPNAAPPPRPPHPPAQPMPAPFILPGRQPAMNSPPYYSNRPSPAMHTDPSPPMHNYHPTAMQPGRSPALPSNHSPAMQSGRFPATQAGAQPPPRPAQYGYGGMHSPISGSLPHSAAPWDGYSQPSGTSPGRTGPSPRPSVSSIPPDLHISLLPLFKAVDREDRGQLTERELGSALINGDNFSSFDPHTVRMMIRMFDTNRSGTISFEEFCGLWSFLSQWRTLFDRFDTDRSGNISLPEFRDALNAFRYRLSDRFTEVLFRQYDKRVEGHLSFDLFIQASITLKRMTDSFKRYDQDRDGVIQLTFEEYLEEILRQMR